MLPTVRSPIEEAHGIADFLQRGGIGSGAALLDVPCGIGRRAVGLAELGYRVTAVDPNEIGVEAVRGRVPSGFRERITFAAVPRDRLPGLADDERFDAILCLDHALGRGPIADDVALLRRLRAHAREEGLLVLDFLNRDFFAARSRPFSFHVVGLIEQHEFRSFNPLTDVLSLEWKFYERAGEDLKHRTDSRAEFVLLGPRDVASAVESSGWTVAGVWGGWDRETITADRRKLVVLARATSTGMKPPS